MNAARRSRLPVVVPRIEGLECRTLLTGPPTLWSSVGIGGGGSLFSPAISPYNSNDMYVSSDMGELFQSTNGGTAWQQVYFRQTGATINSAVQFTNSPNVLYVVGNNSDLQDSAPYESTDGGQTWNPLASDPTGGATYYLYANPNNQNQLLVTDYNDIYSSTNGGQTWSNVYSNSNGVYVGGAYFNGQNTYVGTNWGLLVSTNGGSSFSLAATPGMPSGEGFMSLSGATQGGTTRLFAVAVAAADAANMYPGMERVDAYQCTETVYTLNVGQGSWTQVLAGNDSSLYFTNVATSASNTNVAYVAGTDGANPLIYETTNGGTTWQSVFLTTNNQNISTAWEGSGNDHPWSFGALAQGFTVDAANPNDAVMTDLGFAYETTNGGTTWQSLNVTPATLNPAGSSSKAKAYQDSGLDNTSVWSVDWVNANNMVIGNTDIGSTHSTNGGSTFAFDSNGYNTTYWSVTQPSTGIVYAATSSIHDMYQSTHLTESSVNGGNGAVLYSTNQGTTWQTLHNFNMPVVWVALDPTNPNRLYASVVRNSSTGTAGGIYITNDLQDGASSVWTQLAAPPRTQGHPFDIDVLNNGTLVVTFSALINTSGAFTASSGVFVSTNQGQTWTDVSAPNMDYWTTDLTVDPADPTQNTWFVGVWSGWGGSANNKGGLYETTNAGKTWTEVVNTGLNVTSLAINPNNTNEAYMTTENDGLWYSNNIQSASPTFTQVTSYPFYEPERVFFSPYNPNQVWVTSFGGGLLVGNTGDTAPSVTGESPANGRTGVAVGTTVTATFNEAIESGTLAFALDGPGNSAVPATVTYNSANNTATLTPSSPLAAGTAYTATVSGAQDAQGTAMAAPFTWSFTTADIAPTVTAESPANGGTGIALGTAVTATFSKSIQSGTFSFTLTGPGNSAVPATVTYNSANNIATLQPSSPLTAGTVYTATVSGAKDALGTAMAAPVSWSFTTDTAPAITAKSPANGATGIALGTAVTATFSKSIQSGTLSFILTGPGNNGVPATVTYNSANNIATLQPSSPLTAGAVYTATVSAANDAQGTAMTAPVSWSFTADTAPAVTAQSPASGATQVAVGTSVTATFTESIVSGSLAFTLTGAGNTAVPASLSYNDTTHTATLQPSSALVADTVYTVTVSGVTDVTGTAMAAPLVWSFTTVSMPGTLQFSAPGYSISDANGSVVLTVTRTGGSQGAVSVNYATSDGSAKAATDYTASTGTLDLSDGVTSQTLTIPILNDAALTGNVAFTVTLANPGGGASLGAQTSTAVTILDNTAPAAPGKPQLSPQSDTGFSNSDDITQANGSTAAPLVFTVANVSPADGFVQLQNITNPASLVPLGAPVQATGGTATITLASVPLADGSYQIAASAAAFLGGRQSALSAAMSLTIQTNLRVTTISPAQTFLTSLPNNQVVVTFSHWLADLAPDKADGSGFASNPFAVMLVPSGPDGLATEKLTGAFWSAPSGYDSGDLPLPGALVYHQSADGTSTITLTPNVPLATDVYLIAVSGLRDLAGNPVASSSGQVGSVFSSFDYRPTPSNTAPLNVVSVTTNGGSVAINNNKIPQPDTIAIQFNKPLDAYTVNSGTIQLFGGNTLLPSAVTYSPSTGTAYLTPEAILSPGTIYYVSASSSVSDDQGFPNPGVALGRAYVTSFTVNATGGGAAHAPLVVTATNPEDHTVRTGPLGYGTVTFSEPINVSSLGRFSAMLIPQTGGATTGASGYADVPYNAKLAFNPNTDQLIIVPTGLLANGVVQLFALSALKAQDGDPLTYPGQTLPVYNSFLLNVGAQAHVIARSSAGAPVPAAASTAPTNGASSGVPPEPAAKPPAALHVRLRFLAPRGGGRPNRVPTGPVATLRRPPLA